MRIAVATLLFLSLSASAQTFEQSTFLRIHEHSMSARGAAMGGASDALADDVSDLAANPALSASLKNASFAISAAQSQYDTPPWFWDAREERTAESLAHASVAIPLRNVVIGAYYRDNPRVEYNRVSPEGGLQPYTLACGGDDCSYFVGVNAVAFDRRERSYGVTAAFDLGALSMGAGLERQDLNEAWDQLMIVPNTNRSDLLMRRMSGTALVPNAGLRWRVSPRVALAAAYKGSGEFDYSDDTCIVDTSTATCTSAHVPVGRAQVRRADSYRASIAVRPVDGLALTAEGVRTNYTRSDEPEQALGVQSAIFPHRNPTELHLGAEYRLPRLPISLRAGWWREESKWEYSFFNIEGATDHRTIGAGIDVGPARIDVAYDDANTPSLRRAVVGVTWTGQ
ncbi:MAG TPA: hypothetical protein VHW00_17140 [Thermoanaerobaculia bacterium]|nr:hypothetical protein [Thermoanaerobaculia bacterium]